MKGVLTKLNFRRQLFLLLGLLCSTFVWAQSANVTGTVRDAKGETIIGVNIVIKGTGNGAITDAEGRFDLPSVKPGDILVFSFIGYVTEEVPYQGQKVIDLVLTEDTKTLEEVVVIGYGQVRKGDATGSLTSVKVDSKTKGFAPNAQDILVGKVAGVHVTNAGGSPTAGATIRIRGGSSLSASNDPLIIVDGVPLDNNGVGGVGNMLSTINPNDIETFVILKDASATAIYGSRASNGVILITTKKGSSDKFRITYDGNVTFSTRTKDIDVLNAREYRSFLEKTFEGQSNYDEVMGKLGNADTDWQDEIFKVAVSTEHNLSMFGSVKQFMPYRVSLGYTKVDGILKTSDMKRYTGSVSLNPTLWNDHLKINLNGKAMYIESRFANQGAIGAAVLFDPTQSVYDEDSPYGGYFTWTGADGSLLSTATKNPVSMLKMNKNTSDAFDFIGNAQFDYKLHFLPDLRFNLNLGIDYSRSSGGQYIPEMAPSDYLYGGYDGNWEQRRRNLLLDFYMQYSKDFSFLDSHFDIMGGYSWQHFRTWGNNHDYRIAKYDEYGNPEVVSIGDYINDNYLVSFFGRVNYSIANKYLVTFTLRNDGSSRFSKDNRWGLFPAVAVAWRASQENFLKNSNVVSDLKLRLGWGVTGQQDINQGNYPYLGSYQSAVGNQTNYPLGNVDGAQKWVPVMRPLAYNADIKWESTTTYNAGIDYGFLKNRINGSVDFYYRKTKDLINAETKTAAGTNFSEYVVANIGSLKNTGVEFSLNAVPVQNANWRWEIGTNFAYNKNEIVRLSFGDNTNSIRRFDNVKVHQVGHAAGMYYVYEQIYDQNGKPIEGFYVDRNKDKQKSEEDLRPYHKSTPDWTVGVHTRLAWKAWDLSLAGHGSIGNYNYNAMAAGNASLAAGSVYQSEFLLNRVKSAFATNYLTTQSLSDYYIQNASFFRIDNITLGWSFKRCRAFPLDGRIYASVQNPVVFTRYDGLDPEIDGGIDNNFYPRPLSVMLGVNLNF